MQRLVAGSVASGLRRYPQRQLVFAASYLECTSIRPRRLPACSAAFPAPSHVQSAAFSTGNDIAVPSTSGKSPEKKLGIIAKIRRVIRTLFGANDDTPRGIQERKDMYWIFLTVALRKLRIEKQRYLLESSSDHATWQDEPKEELKDLMEEAASHLDDQTDINKLPLKKLRGELQTFLGPQIVQLLTAAHDVEEEMRSWHGFDDDDYSFTKKEEREYRDILVAEYESVCQLRNDCLESTDGQETRRTSDPLPFYERKKRAIETLFSYFDWWPEGSEVPATSSDVDGQDYVDDFGFSPNKSDPDIVGPMRYYHARNLVRSTLVRSSGNSLSTFKSTVPSAGRGVFVDGFAPAGTLLAFFPGKVWPKEHLMSASLQTQMEFSENDPRHQLSMRYDDILVDSRRSPYTVVRNLWALGHIVNHPPAPAPSQQKMAPPKNDSSEGDNEAVANPALGANCITVSINFTKQMLEQHEGLRDYLPTEYEMPPKDYAKNALGSHDIEMHGMGLVALRDVKDEELFYDYRLSPDNASKGTQYPGWYYVWDEEAINNRWSSES